MEYLERSLNELVQGLRDGVFSSRELTTYYLDRINKLDSSIHAFLALDPERALAQADQADAVLADWRSGKRDTIPALLGLPIAILTSDARADDPVAELAAALGERVANR